MATILAVGYVEGGEVHYRLAPLVSQIPVSDDEVEATIEEVMGKPNLGIFDAPPFIDYDAELDDLIEGRLD